MNRALLLPCLLLFTLHAVAQTAPAPKRTGTRLTEKSVVKDSTGRVLAYSEWRPLMQTGDYIYRPENPGDTARFLLVKLTDAQKKQRDEARKTGKPFSISYTGKSYRVNFTEKTLVKDSAGHVLPYSIWHPMLESGEFMMHRSAMGVDTAYHLVPSTPEIRARRQQMIAESKPPESKFFTIGQPITPFAITDIAGKKISAEDWTGKTVVLCFWYSTWASMEKTVAALNKLVEKYHDDPKVLFIGIALDQEDALKDFNTLTPFNYRLVGNGRPYAQALKVGLFPTHVVINRKGTVSFHSSGMYANTPAWIDKAIAESEAGK